ncbi:MAG: hypothetical protein PHR77_21500 [Kiritimatiellae bacterium]|nr:hypothetical protein [Kiritimatiellia bacterium]MDD5520125.1 hypothetical protein [Kiritimatiellia bacterium]
MVTHVNVTFLENFNEFRGTLDSLPVGWAVSVNGSTILNVTNDFNGVHSGGVTAGGCYAWMLNSGDYALGYQPITEEFTPGFFMVVVSNATESAVKECYISYEVVCLNNADRSSSLDLEMSFDGVSFSRVNELTFVSPLARDVDAVWQRSLRSCCLMLPQPLSSGHSIWFRWYGDDVAGSSSRDEYGIDNFMITFRFRRGMLIKIQ